METLHAPSAWRRSRVIVTLFCALGLLATLWAGATGHLPMAGVLGLATAALVPRSLLGRRARRHAVAPPPDQRKSDWRKAA